MAEHTPGPWRYEPSRGGYTFRDDEPNGEYIIIGSNEHGGYVLPILARTHNWPRNAEANARLIAAAPELLAALNGMVGLVQLVCGRPDIPQAVREALEESFRLEDARAAIAKARGEAP